MDRATAVTSSTTAWELSRTFNNTS
jgi:hypothetical protein